MSAARYQAAGFARFGGVIPVAAAQAAAAWIARNRTRGDVPHTRDVHDRGNALPIKLRQLWNCDPTFWQDFLVDADVLRLARTLLGPEFYLIRSAAFIKYPRSRGEVGWHCDADLWGHPCDAGLTAWVPLTAVPEHSGCLNFIPGSHHGGHGKLYWDLHHPFHKVMDVSAMAAPIPLPAVVGDCIVMDRHTVHGSGANRSDAERIGLVLAFARCPRQALNEPALACLPDGRFEPVEPA